MRRFALMLVVVSVLGAGVAAGPAHAAKKITNCKKDKNLNENLMTSFDAFLAGSTTAEKVKYIENGDKVAKFVEEGNQEAVARGQTSSDKANVTVNLEAECDGKKAATFTYDLAIGLTKPVTTKPATGAGLNFSGEGILDKKTGTWFISAATICDLLGAGNPERGQRCLAEAV